jgi:hypothetical protein
MNVDLPASKLINHAVAIVLRAYCRAATTSSGIKKTFSGRAPCAGSSLCPANRSMRAPYKEAAMKVETTAMPVFSMTSRFVAMRYVETRATIAARSTAGPAVLEGGTA